VKSPLRLIQDTTPSAAVVRCLEALLERAREGEIRGLVVAFESKGTQGHAMAWEPDVTPMALVGELHLAQFSVLLEAGRVKPL
jgi:hypothetical protein